MLSYLLIYHPRVLLMLLILFVLMCGHHLLLVIVVCGIMSYFLTTTLTIFRCTPLNTKSDVFSKFIHFSNYIKNQFDKTINAIQCDNGGVYNNQQFHNHFSAHGIQFRFSCPHTTPKKQKMRTHVTYYK